MARDSGLRQTPRESPAQPGRFALLRSLSPTRLAAALAVVAAAFLAVYHLAGDAGKAPAEPAFLTSALGAPQRSASFVRKPAPSIKVKIEAGGGYTVADRSRSVTLAAEGTGSGSWHAYVHGASRSTPFGSETVAVKGGRTEQFLTVTHRQGKKTWSWSLGTKLHPSLSPDGSVLLSDRSGSGDFRLLPVAILTAAGVNITPAGLAWKLKRAGSAWKVELTLDDSSLPVPYVIDPAVVASAVSETETGGDAARIVLDRPARAAPGDLLLAQVTVKGGTDQTITAPQGWTLLRRDDETDKVGQAIYYRLAAAGDPASWAWTFSSKTQASGGIVTYTGIDAASPIDASSGTSVHDQASVTAPSLTTSVRNAVVVGFFGSKDKQLTRPDGMAPQLDSYAEGGSHTVSIAADLILGTAGPSGDYTATISDKQDAVGQLVALRPAAPDDVTAPDPGVFVSDELGTQQAAPLVRQPRANTRVRIESSGGLRVTHGGSSVVLSSRSTGRAAWTTHANGAARPTTFGADSVTVTPGETEQYLTVNTYQGQRTWKWDLATTDATPTLEPDGSVTFADSSGKTVFTILPVRIYDHAKNDVTPAGAKWGLGTNGSARVLTLTVDDAGLPLPYVIDPTIVSPTYRSSSTNSTTGATLTISQPSGVAAGDLLLAQITWKTSGTTPTVPSGWTQIQTDTASYTSGKNSRWLRQRIYYHVAGSGESGPYSWPFGSNVIATGVIVAYSGTLPSAPIDTTSGDSATADGTSMTAPSLTTSAANEIVAAFFGSDQADKNSITKPSGTTTRDEIANGSYSQADDYTQASAGATGPQTATQSKSTAWVAQQVALKRDSTAPTQTLGVTAGTRPDLQYFDSGSNTIYYNPAATGTFTVTSSPSDPESGIASVLFPGFGGYADAVQGDSPVSYWRLGDTSGTTAVDAQGYQDGTYTGGYTLNQTGALSGDTDKAVLFNGSSGYVSVGNPANLKLSTGTMEAWIKTSNAGSGYHDIVEKGSAYDLTMNNNVLGLWDWGGNTFRTTGVNVADGTWHHVVATFQSGVSNGTKVYLDGSLVLTTTITVSNQNSPLWIGACVRSINGGCDSGDETFGGTIDDVAVYDSVLSQAQVQAHYDAASTAPAPTGFSASSATATSSPWQSATHTFTSANTTAPSAETITVTNGVGSTNTTSLTFVRDTTAPSGQSVALSGGPWYTTASVPLTINWGSDAGAGLDASTEVVQRDSATLSNGSCGSFSGSWSTVTLVSGADTSVVSGNCYRYRLRVSDRVANQATSASSSDAKVDTSAPSAPNISITESSPLRLPVRDHPLLQQLVRQQRLVPAGGDHQRRPERDRPRYAAGGLRKRRRRRHDLAVLHDLQLDVFEHRAAGTRRRVLRQREPHRHRADPDGLDGRLQLGHRLSGSVDPERQLLGALDRPGRAALLGDLHLLHPVRRRRAALGQRPAARRQLDHSLLHRGQRHDRAHRRAALRHQDGVLRAHGRRDRPALVVERQPGKADHPSEPAPADDGARPEHSRPARAELVLARRRHDGPDRADQHPRRRPLVHDHLRPPHPRLGLGQRQRPRQLQQGRRARLRPAHERLLRHLQRHLEQRHPRRRRRHHRHHRQLLPLPRPDQRQRRQPERQLHPNRRRQGRHHRPQRTLADPDRVLAAQLRQRHDALLQRAGLQHRLIHRRRHLDRRPVRHRRSSPSPPSPA